MKETFSVVDDEDRLFIDRARAGDVAAFGELVKKYRGRVEGLAFRITGNAHDAEDLSQEAFVKAFVNLRKFRGDCPFRLWVQRIVANGAINHSKRRRRTVLESECEDPVLEKAETPEAKSPAAETEEKEFMQNVRLAVEALPVIERTVFQLAVTDEMSHQEIASVLGCAEGTVSWRLFRARKMLLKSLGSGVSTPPSPSPPFRRRGNS